MGSASSKFKKYLQHGDEFAAMQIFQSSPELRKNLDPNLSYGDHHGHNTALHYAARHGMKHLLRTFLADLGGNPNKRNGRNESSLHCACQLNQTKSFSAQERRAACVTLLLQWKGVVLSTGARERVDLGAQDQEGNTALHWAACTGLKRCVELLLAHGAPLFVENNDKLTPCDLAMRSNHHDIAQLLESRMVFADSSDTVNEDEGYLGEQEEVYSGLRTQDLQEAKDQLLVETSDMLHIPLFTAEALLRDNEWSREALLEKWMKDPVECCQLAGVQAPASAFQYSGSVDISCSSPEVPPEEPGSARLEIVCEICLCPMTSWDQPPVMMSCKHQFCAGCWERYLTVKIQDGDAHHILCPAYQCHILVPVEVIERLVSPEMARRYLQFDIKAFVESNKSIKWCPVAGCGRAVRLPETEQSQPLEHGQGKPLVPITSHAVDCGNAHFFCWECLGEAHAPSGCSQWQEWQKKIAEVKPEELRTSCNESEDAANCLWLVTNSKPCPNCKSPIQKNEGCNHMKCSKCKFDFCWVCQESWKRHSSATGGYFRCNRFEAAHRADEKQDSLISEAQVRNTHVQELSRFLHYYTRFRNHENSQRLEEPLLTGIRQKMELLASTLPHKSHEESAEKGTRFVEDGVRELLKARRVLCGSYVYGYYLEDNGYNKTIFEFMQNELEEVTEKLSEMIARPYLRTPKAVIVQTTALTRRKRHEFVRAVAKGLVPPETPPALRKVRKRGYADMEMTEALAASLKHLDGNAPWMKDGQSSHKVAALYEWPDYDSDEDTEVNRALAVSLVGECKAPNCGRPRARNPRTGALHQYCSLRCSRLQEIDCDMYRMPLSSDYNMELVIALEMSRLQMIEDKMKQAQANNGVPAANENVGNPGTSVDSENNTDDSSYGLDDQLKLAIQLSLQESTAAISRQLQLQENRRDEMNSSEANNSGTHYQRTNADITVDYFLKSLANQKIDLKNIGVGMNVFSGEKDSDKECFFKPCSGNEDGRFQISDIHENGYAFGDVDDYDENDIRLKRSHSTGDLCIRRSGRGFRVRTTGDEPRYHLDSDHSSQHDEKPEDISRRILALPSGSARTKQFFLLQNSTCPQESPTYQGQSSVEDTTTSDSLNADMEVCGILEAVSGTDTACTSFESDEYRRQLEKSFEGKYLKNEEVCSSSRKTEGISKIEELKKHNPFATLKAKLCSAHLPKTSYLTKIAVNKSIGLLSDPKNKKEYEDTTEPKLKVLANVSDNSRRNSDHGIQFKKKLVSGISAKQSPKSLKHTKNPKRDSSFSKSTSFLLDTHKKDFKMSCGKTVTTNLRIKICKSPVKSAKPRQLETDSSNEYESETGIPKSPTLFISGVSISRTPEPKSPGAALINGGRQSRSSSLSVPVPIQSCTLSLSNTSLNNTAAAEPFTPSLVRSTTPATSRSGLHQSPGPSPHKEQATKAKSASEPEREREMFRFPKSSTDGALSSVLHVQESNLSSDDFHEALFLLERSPKTRDSKRRKKSKKKEKEADRMKEEASSAL